MRVHTGWLTLSSIALLACPLGPLPGGGLDGEPGSPPPDDWSFSEAYWTIQLEVRPDHPYSVNVWCVAKGGNLYTAAGQGESSAWARALLEDGRARVRIGTVLYEVIATRVSASAEIEAYLEGLAEKYDLSDAGLSDFESEPGEAPAAILFRLAASPRKGVG